jgi:S-DNA-T family DNA segregation ATPase FtsK/SpoIIIE
MPMTSEGRRIHIEGGDPSWNSRKAPIPGIPKSAGPPRGGQADSRELAAQVDEERLGKNTDETRRRIADIKFRAQNLDAVLKQVSSEALTAAEGVAASMRGQAQRRRDHELHALSERHSSDAADFESSLSACVDDLAPGIASADWDRLTDVPNVPARFLRVGSISVGAISLPAILPFIGTAGWLVEGDRTACDSLVRSTVVRVVGQAPLKRLSITVFDPRARGVLGQFAPLRQIVGPAFPVPTSDPNELSDRLKAALDKATADSEGIVSSGFGDLIEQWRTAPIPEGTLQLIVILDFPFGVNDELIAQLERAAATEGPVRPCLLIAGERGSMEQKVDANALRRLLIPIAADGQKLHAATYPDGIELVGDAPPSESVIAAVVVAASERAKSDTGVSFPLTELLVDDVADPWRHDATESLDIVLGKVGRGTLELSIRTENPPHPNVLIGGAVGTGKSNLLLDIVYGLASRYSPEELELHLLDFKRGVEFARFAPDGTGQNWLPHVRTLGLESDRAFGLAVLRSIHQEMATRAELFKKAGVSSFNDYRTQTGASMSRLVLIVDEFHALFAGDDDHIDEVVAIFDNLARQGRSNGVHLLMASQTTSGVAALAVKGESIFAQFPIRISLKNTPTESEAILSSGNKAASELTYRGEVVFNKNFGLAADGSNQLGIVAYAEPAAMAELQCRLWEKGHGSPPLVFNGSEYATWPSGAPAPSREGLSIWVGRPIAVSYDPYSHQMTEDADQAVVVLGKPWMARTAIETMVLSALGALRHGSIVVLDGEGVEADDLMSNIERHAADEGVAFERLDRHAAATWVRRTLRDRLDSTAEADPLLVVGLSLQRLLDMDDDPDNEMENDELSFSSRPSESGRAVLARLAHDGAKNQGFFIGSWANWRTMESDLGSYSPGVALYVTAELGLEDLRNIAGHTAHPIEGAPRLGIFERNGNGKIQTVVPYAIPRILETSADD